MRGAFVLRVNTAHQVIAGQIEGSVEEVDTGTEFRFRSERELIGYLRERVAEIRGRSRKEKPHERTDDLS